MTRFYENENLYLQKNQLQTISTDYQALYNIILQSHNI